VRHLIEIAQVRDRSPLAPSVNRIDDRGGIVEGLTPELMGFTTLVPIEIPVLRWWQ
jgi:hypothetical protein